MAAVPSVVEQCGCEIRDVNGNLAINTMKAVAFETNLIQKEGHRFLPEVDPLLDSMVPKVPSTPGEGENPRDYVEYSFGLANTDIEATDLLASGEETINASLKNCQNQDEVLAIVQKESGSLACDPRSVTLIAGRQEYRGVNRLLATVKTTCVCILDFARTKNFPEYLRGVRGAMPVESATLKERDMLRQLMSTAQYSVAEAGSNKLQFQTGSFAHKPQGGPQMATFRRIRDIQKANGHIGNVVVNISLTGLISMMAHYYQVMGLVHQVQKWTGGEWPIMDGVFSFEGIDFKICDNPIRGTLDEIASSVFQFNPLSTRSWVAGNGAGAVYNFNLDSDQPTVMCEGEEKEVYELIPIISKQAYSQKPFGMVDPGVDGVKAAMWTGTTVRTVSGAFIPNNERMQKFYFALDHTYRLIPQKPYLAGFVLVRVVSYPRMENLIGLNGNSNLLAAAPITIGTGEQMLANSAADSRAGLNALEVGPARTEACTVTNVVGKFYMSFSAVVSSDASSIVLVVERRDGTSGAASLPWTLDDGTGVAATDYTDASGTLTWLDGESGPKTVTVAIPATARHGKTFVANWGTAVGATKAVGHSSDTTVTIHRAPKDYILGAGVTGALTGITADGGALAIGGSYAATAAGAALLQDAINDVLGGNGSASVTFATDWNITIENTTVLFTSATDGTNTATFSVV